MVGGLLERSGWVVGGAMLSSVAFSCGGNSSASDGPAGGRAALVAGGSGVVGGAGGAVSGVAGPLTGNAGLDSHSGGGGASAVGGSGVGGSGVGGSAVGGSAVGGNAVGGSSLGGNGAGSGGEAVGGGGTGGNGGSAGSAGNLGKCVRLPGYDPDCAKAYTDKPQAYGCNTETAAAMMSAARNWKCDSVELVEAARFNICCPP